VVVEFGLSFYPALSLPAVPCLALPCLALPCPALPCPALPCPALPCLALPCPALPSICIARQMLPAAVFALLEQSLTDDAYFKSMLL